MLHGSYQPSDVTFLLKEIDIPSTAIETKERLIQSGQRHYSEMITRERLPSSRYLAQFHSALEQEKQRFARHLLVLAQLLANQHGNSIVLVSLARAGTPIGVLLNRVLQTFHNKKVNHYSISIIRDRGIDRVALRYIVQKHSPNEIEFVDGWTGKGVIARELHSSIVAFNQDEETNLDGRLVAVADLCGIAKYAASTEDYLIPSSILGATISGLISRSILNADYVGPDDFHGCLYYREFLDEDLSQWFIETMMTEIAKQAQNAELASLRPPSAQELLERQAISTWFLTNINERFHINNVNYIKPGIGEATRVLLRRVPQLLLLQDRGMPEVQHLVTLAEEKNVEIREDAHLPYLATALIQEME